MSSTFFLTRDATLHVSKITILQYFEVERDDSKFIKDEVLLNHKISTLHFLRSCVLIAVPNLNHNTYEIILIEKIEISLFWII